MTSERAQRLARLAQSRAGGGRGLRACLAWRTLTRAGDRGDVAAAEAVWQALRRRPDDELWATLSRWRNPADLTEEACTEATAPDRSKAERGALTEFCLRHGLAPRDAVQRAGFFALTGQPDQRRALDPDGSLLAAAYRAASPATRGALREALAGAGDLDVVRVVAGSGPSSRVADMTAAERRYLCRHLADRRDWAELWRLAKDLPVADAVDAARLIDGHWRPSGQRDREWYGLLTRFDGNAARVALAKPVQIDVPGPVLAGALSADGTRLAAATTGFEHPLDRWPAPVTISVFSLPDGAVVMRYGLEGRSALGLAYASGGTTLIILDSRWDLPSAPRGDARLYRCPDGQPMARVFQEQIPFGRIAARRRGFVIAGYDGSRSRHVLSFHRADGHRFQRRFSHPWYSTSGRLLAVDHDSGRLAVGNSAGFTVYDAARAQHLRAVRTHEIYSTVFPEIRGFCFQGRGHVILTRENRVVRVRVESSGRLEYCAEARVDLPGAGPVVLVPARDEVCALDGRGNACYFDASSLRPAGRAGELTGLTGTALWNSADNSCHALGGHGVVHAVTRESLILQDVADRPQAAWRPLDLVAAGKAAAALPRSADTQPLWDLLLGCLEQRFGEEVRLGRWALTGDGLTAAAEDDIELADAELFSTE